jgi:hypothetical protein
MLALKKQRNILQIHGRVLLHQRGEKFLCLVLLPPDEHLFGFGVKIAINDLPAVLSFVIHVFKVAH